eukprot:CAMPEP_0206555428 /NCGR_PEP_ID=MMETSP0325_2-20121206/17788_1 /ASSEMBLY_ACC=CAM_ASM_000347 /TAXON_ID=2866 /ORGANISM="Crypthecodinium cohnii, Strain Seligo" /LENGTH=747 /DNA_ID=CAMNT_0054055727 /DNA_START=100 /DNA_END=2343 /DNA_ORIENTATION=+
MAWYFEALLLIAGVATALLHTRKQGVTTSNKCTAGGTSSGRLDTSFPGWISAITPRLVVFLWWLLAISCQESDSASYLVASSLLVVAAPEVPASELTAILATTVARHAFLGGFSYEIFRFSWLPWLLLTILRWDEGLFGLPGSRTRSRTGSKPLAHSDGDDREISVTERVLMDLKEGDWLHPRPFENKVYHLMFGLEGKDNALAVYPCCVYLEAAYGGHLYLAENHLGFQGVSFGGVYTVQFRFNLDEVCQILGGGRRGCAIIQLRSVLDVRSSSKWCKWIADPVCEFEIANCREGLNAVAAVCARRRGVRISWGCEDDMASPTTSGMPSSPPTIASETKERMEGDTTPYILVAEDTLQGFDLKAFAQQLIADTYEDHFFLSQYLAKMNVYDIEWSPWEEPRDIKLYRKMTSTTKLPPAPMCPATSTLAGWYMVWGSPELFESSAASSSSSSSPSTADTSAPLKGGLSFTTATAKSTCEVPFGTKFEVQEKIDFVTNDSGGVHIKIQGRVIFTGNCGMLTGKIRSTGNGEITKSLTKYHEMIKDYRPGQGRPLASLEKNPQEDNEDSSSSTPQLHRPSQSCSTTSPFEGDTLSELTPQMSTTSFDTTGFYRVEWVWELQRRTTIFGTEWNAPFLPHDGKKSVRWVDVSYKPHPLLKDGPNQDPAACASPPLKVPSGYKPISGWQVEASAGTDPDGWEYAVDFYRSDRYWHSTLAARSVRRRRWKAKFVEARSDQNPDSSVCTRGGTA